jgi:hypothetical protein
MENLENQVDKILENSKDIISLRTKLNSIVNAIANNILLGNHEQKIGRYKTMADYFSKNKDRIGENRTYLVDAMYNLTKYFPNSDAESACKKIKSLLDENADDTFKQDFMNRPWEDFEY